MCSSKYSTVTTSEQLQGELTRNHSSGTALIGKIQVADGRENTFASYKSLTRLLLHCRRSRQLEPSSEKLRSGAIAFLKCVVVDPQGDRRIGMP